MLAKQGIEPDHPDDLGRTPLRIACQGGISGIVQDLLDTSQVNVNARDDLDQSPLLVAVLHEHYHLIGPLMEAGADPELRDFCRDTAYSVAEKAGDYISLRRLREAVKLQKPISDSLTGVTAALAS
ncbi:ankyrin repeat-containing domain protein [Aspergillus pseudoustus]|uniref:Ankyrin repeat-containing domain protein n=1 Tax=Aspergillus pseudoustus TaxID=1810923 RepID=A0ABR4J5M1_9EURO